MTGIMGAGRWNGFSCGLFLFLAAPDPASAQGIIDISANPVPPFDGLTLFPNWKMAPTSEFAIEECDPAICTWCPNGDIVGLTILNLGTAQAGTDIQAMYWGRRCGNKNPLVLQTMTYAGVWNQGGIFVGPAWTWAGPPTGWTGNICDALVQSECVCKPALRIYTDISACPVEGRTVRLAPGYYGADPNYPGGVTDDCGYAGPANGVTDPAEKTIRYSTKTSDKFLAAPGDTINYTITYGLPGTAALSSIEIMDSLPPFTHLVATGVPAPDVSWNPDPGPPLRLRWTIPGPLPTAFGPTNQVTFTVSVDWGNGDAFEPGSGDTAAPERALLQNFSAVTFNGSSCAQKASVASGAPTAVRRFLMWKIGDNDMLFAPSVSQPPDEMTYSIFIKNVSPTMTWWDVHLWDTVPAELNVWNPGYGFEDPCSGWTMTPSGCSAASPGWKSPGATTVMTWKLDLPPGMTLEVHWKAQLRPTATAGGTAINIASMLAYGRTGIVGGTGNSGQPRTFAHIAQIILPTTYVSYTAYSNVNYGTTYALDFFPLNKNTQFQLYGLEYEGSVPFAANGGVSASINCFIGDCLGGYAGNAGPCPTGPIPLPVGSIPGCKVERAPSQYIHDSPAVTFNNVYKIVSNSPVAWQTMTDRDSQSADHIMYSPSSSMSYTGLIHYFWRRTDSLNQEAGRGDALTFMSTGKNAYGVYDPALATTVHEFQFDYASLTWQYRNTFEMGAESQATDATTLIADEGPWRSISSDAQLIVEQGYNAQTATASPLTSCCCGPCGHSFSSVWPTRESGNVVVKTGETAYGIVLTVNMHSDNTRPDVAIGNLALGGPDAICVISRYIPDPGYPTWQPGIPNMLRGSVGTWVYDGTVNIPAGFAAPLNPFMAPDMGGNFVSSDTAEFKVTLTSGGPVQIIGAHGIFSNWGHGAVLHAAQDLAGNIGTQSGIVYWLHHTYYDDTFNKFDCAPATNVVDIFCPRQAMAVNAVSERGMSATYTTTGPDQCIAFRALSDESGLGAKTNYRFLVQPNPAQGNVISIFMSCGAEKGFTAPFMKTGTHYVIIAPPTVFIGQSFWITVVVIDATDTTKNDYCGTTSFTSTDPAAKIEGNPMDTYNYTWSSNVTPCGTGPFDNGVRVFVNVSMTKLGIQTLIASDTVDGSITGLGAVMVVGADVKLTKIPPLSVQASGDTVRFRVCWSNYSSASAFTFTVTDAVPLGTTFVPEATLGAYDCGNTTGVGVTTAYSLVTSATPPPPGSFINGLPVAATHWLRWTVPYAGVNTTGCFCYRVSIN